MKTTNSPNPARVYEALATILERRHGVKITYTLSTKTQGGENYEQHCNRAV